jgi:hypothetical protein
MNPNNHLDRGIAEIAEDRMVTEGTKSRCGGL